MQCIILIDFLTILNIKIANYFFIQKDFYEIIIHHMAIQNIDKRGGNLLAKYSTEKEGQIAFFKTYQPYISQIKDKTLEDILLQYTDGIIGGNILEFKLNISDINKVLFQTIKYLSKCRINGIAVPAKILLISLNNSIVYKFDSAHFLSQIEKLYIGAIIQQKPLFISYKIEQRLLIYFIQN